MLLMKAVVQISTAQCLSRLRSSVVLLGATWQVLGMYFSYATIIFLQNPSRSSFITVGILKYYSIVKQKNKDYWSLQTKTAERVLRRMEEVTERAGTGTQP
jgi:hypothetical protein